MGISLAMIERMESLGLFGKGRISVLDVGSSNLYSANTEGIVSFLSRYGEPTTAETNQFATRLAQGSAYDSVSGGTNGAFVGELFEKVGWRYNAIDIADGYRTTILDLNHEPAPRPFVGAFDVVMNFGTTEHLLNQYNAFKVIHDSTKVGGYIIHSLPCVGYSNHGYFTYTPRCMFDLAGYNEYELVAFWFEGPGNGNDLFAPVRDYQSYFPALSLTLAEHATTETGRCVTGLNLPDIGLVVVYRKVKARPFAGALERSTSVGTVPTSVTSEYERNGQRGRSSPGSSTSGSRINAGSLWRRLVALFGRTHHEPKRHAGATQQLDRHDEIPLEGKAAELRDRFLTNALDLDESLVFYSLVTETHGYFPFDWEYRILLLGLERDPSRSDLAERLIIVRSQM